MRVLAALALTVTLLPAQQGVNLYSLDKERAMGEHIAADIRKQSQPFNDPEVQAYVARLGAELAAHLPEPRFEYRFEVIRTTERIEPIAVPGGHVFVPVNTILACKDEHEFAALLAHSIAHIALRHGTRSATRQQIVNMASIPLIHMGGWSGVHSDTSAAATLVPMSLLKFQRQFELDADRLGVELAHNAGYDASALEKYIDREQKADTPHSPLPTRDSRITALQTALAALPAATEPRRSDTGFQRAQEAVRKAVERPREVPTLKR